MKRTKIFLASLVVVLGLGLIGVWGLFFAGKLNILADLVSPQSTTTKTGVNVTKIVSPTPQQVVDNGFNSATDTIKVNLDINGLSQDQMIDKPLDMVAVLDFTDSMSYKIGNSQTTKIAALKSTFTNLTNLFAQKNVGRAADKSLQLGVVAYNGEMTAINNLHTKAFDLTTDYAALNTDVQGLTLGLNTNMGEGLQAGRDLFVNLKTANPDRYNNSVKVVILLSDGMHNTGIDPTADSVLNYFRQNNLPIYTIGFGTYISPDPTKPEDVVDAASDMSDKSKLWCKDKSAPYLVTIPALSGDLHRYYCLAKDLFNPGSHQLGYRLNALAIETRSQYFNAPDAATLDQAFQNIFKDTVLTKKSSIEVNENFDAGYSFVTDSLIVSGPRGALTAASNAENFFTDNVGLDKYFVQSDTGGIKIWVSKGTANNGEKITASFNLKSNLTDQDSCIDKTSNVKWGDIDTASKSILDSGKLAQEDLPQYCYNLKVVSPNNPSQENLISPLLATGVNILMLAIISIVLIAAIFYILALIKEK
jgi:hypothetical protein